MSVQTQQMHIRKDEAFLGVQRPLEASRDEKQSHNGVAWLKKECIRT